MSPRLLAGGQESLRGGGGGCLEGSPSHTGLPVLCGHPVRNRAPFDGSKQCLMTQTHLIRLKSLQESVG